MLAIASLLAAVTDGPADLALPGRGAQSGLNPGASDVVWLFGMALVIGLIFAAGFWIAHRRRNQRSSTLRVRRGSQYEMPRRPGNPV